MQSIIFNYEYDFSKILIFEMVDNFNNNYYKIDLLDLNKEKFIRMLQYFCGFGSSRVFPFKIIINNEYGGNGHIFHFNAYQYFRADKFYNYISTQNSSDYFHKWILNLWDDFEIDKFMIEWKKYPHEVEFVAKIKKIHDEIIIKDIIE